MIARDPVRTLEAKCSCGSIHFTIDVPQSSLPLPGLICQCSLCRFATGAPCIFHTPLSSNVHAKYIAPSSESNLTGYLAKGLSATYYFCSTCGCHISAKMPGRDGWSVSSSIFKEHGPDIFQLQRSYFSKSAKDGGIAQFLTHVGGRDVVDWNPPADCPTSNIVEASPEVGADGQERLRAECHCGGVSFTIRRPTKELAKDPDMVKLMYGPDKKKWLGAMDACGDCRLANGTDVTGWILVPLSFCEPAIKPDLMIGTSKTYSSSPGVLRSFCGVCGAHVFFTNKKRYLSDDRYMVNVAAGILRAPEGYMADNWIGWLPLPPFYGSGKRYDKDMIEALMRGLENYVEKRAGKEPTMKMCASIRAYSE